MQAIRVNELRKTFPAGGRLRRRDAVEAVAGISFSVAAGERLADEPPHPLGHEEVALGAAGIARGIADHQRLAAPGHVSRQALTDGEIRAQAGMGVLQETGGSPQDETIAVQRPNEDQAVRHELSRGLGGLGEDVAQLH